MRCQLVKFSWQNGSQLILSQCAIGLGLSWIFYLPYIYIYIYIHTHECVKNLDEKEVGSSFINAILFSNKVTPFFLVIK